MVSMKILDHKARSQILHLLCEGNSIRSVTRLTGASKNTVIKLLVDAGKACMAFHDANVRDVKAKRVQVDEIWSFTYAKQKNVAAAKAAPDGAGDTWTWTAIDADSKMILSISLVAAMVNAPCGLLTIFAPVLMVASS
jgi:hypothetical protein